MSVVICKKCGKEFYIKPSQIKLGYGKYCSEKCQHEAYRRGKFFNCSICGKEIWITPKK